MTDTAGRQLLSTKKAPSDRSGGALGFSSGSIPDAEVFIAWAHDRS